MKTILIIPEVIVPNGTAVIIPETAVTQSDVDGSLYIEQDDCSINTTFKHLKEMVEEIEKHL